VPPVVSVSGPSTASVGVPYTLSLSAGSDPGTDSISGWRIDWGDGSVDTLTGNPTSATHTYLQAQSRTITAVARDEDGEYSTGGQTIGILDPSFGVAGQTLDTAGNTADRQMLVFPDGNILTAGGTGVVALSRYTSTGQVDTTFGTGGHLTLNPAGGTENVVALAASPGGQVVIVGTTVPSGGGSATWFAIRVNENGQLDPTFGTNGLVLGTVAPTFVVTSVAVGSDGRIVLGGSLDQGTGGGGVNFCAIRLTAAGTIDTSFNGTGWATVSFGSAANDIAYAVAVESDGSIVLAGVAPDQYANPEAGVAKLTAAGSLDPTFGTGGKVISGFSTYYTAVSIARAVLIQPNGQIVIVGVAAQSQSLSNFPTLVAARYMTGGKLDPTFGTSGYVSDYNTEGTLVAAALEPDGHIVAVSASQGQEFIFPQVVRFTAAGAFDNYFGPPSDMLGVSGMVSLTSPAGTFDATDVALSPAGDILVLAHDELGTLLSKYQTERPSLTVVPQPDVSISGTVFADSNGDGIQTSPADTPIANATVYIDTNLDGACEPGEPTAMTNTNGIYAFFLLPAGTYTVRLQLPAGAYQTLPANNAGYAVTVAAGQVVLGKNFGQTFYGSITGIAFQDNDANGVFGPGDTALAGMQVYLDTNKNGLLDPNELIATTDSNGAYAFNNLRTGTYAVRQVLINGWQQTLPAANAAITITMTSGLAAAGSNFAQTPATSSTGGTISGTVFADANGNGFKDSSESFIPGVILFLDINGDGVWQSTKPTATTNINGSYSFSLLGPGNYRVDQIVPSGYILTAPTTNTYSVVVNAGLTTNVAAFADQPSTSTVKLSGTVMGTTGSGTNTPAKAFDNNLSTFFDGATAGTAASPNWVGLDLGSAYIITSLAYSSRSGYASRMNGGIFQASNTADFSSGVATLYTIGAAENPSSTAITTRQVAVFGAYRYVRYLSLPNTYGDVGEVRFFGVRAKVLTVAAGQSSHITASAATPRTYSYSSLLVQSGGTLIVDAAASRQPVEVYGTGSFLTGGMGEWTSSLNLTSNELDLVGASLTTVNDQVRQGFANGTWAGTGGIISSTAASDPTHLTAIGVIANNAGGGSALYTTFYGLPVAATDILVRTTYYGDANLDGVINGADYQQIDNGFGSHATGWSNGDFNYDGVVDGSDFSLIDNTFNQVTAIGAAPLAMIASADTANPSIVARVPTTRSVFNAAPIQSASAFEFNSRKSTVWDSLDPNDESTSPEADKLAIAKFRSATRHYFSG
jgi:uncharacterized delta-60 repeat protein